MPPIFFFLSSYAQEVHLDQTLPPSKESFAWIILKTSHFVWSTGLPGYVYRIFRHHSEKHKAREVFGMVVRWPVVLNGIAFEGSQWDVELGMFKT